MAGFYAMQRGWMDDAIFGLPAREPLCRRAAWAWLVERAGWEPAEARIEGQIVILARGELSMSIRDMGGQWGWPTTKVARFVSELYQHRFIGTRKIGRQFVISICNYDAFSSQEKAQNRPAETILERSWNDLEVDAGAVSEPLKEESKKEEAGSLRSPAAHANRVASPKTFEVWYGEYPHKVGRAAAEKAYRSALARASPERLLDGLRQYVVSKPPDREWCNPATWLNQHRWLDEPAENTGKVGGNGKHGHIDALREGAAAAAAAVILRGRGGGDIGDGFPAAEPFLDRG